MKQFIVIYFCYFLSLSLYILLRLSMLFFLLHYNIVLYSRAQPEGAKGLKPPLSQVKVQKKDKKF